MKGYEKSKIGLFGRNASESIILKTDETSSNIYGWLIKTPGTDQSKVGDYGITWNSDFKSPVKLDNLDSDTLLLLVEIINKYFIGVAYDEVTSALGINPERIIITETNGIIDIENRIMFNIQDIKRINYTPDLFTIILSDDEEIIVPNRDNALDIIKEIYKKKIKKKI